MEIRFLKRDLLAILLLGFMAAGCREAVEAIAAGDGQGGAGTGDAIENPPVGIVDDSAGFYVRVVETAKFEFYEHKAGDFDSECKIEKTDLDSSNADIVCHFDVPEEDL